MPENKFSSLQRIVVIGGGTGTFTVLSGLRQLPVEVTAVVSTADNGGSTGVLRDELGVLPPGDIRQALVALADESTVLRELFSYRFEDGSLKGHSFGNLFLSALEKVTGSFDQAVIEAGKVLAIQGTVLPVTTDQAHLHAEMSNGEVIAGEHQIETYIWSEISNIDRLWLEPACTIHPLVAKALSEADLIVLGPGSIFTSLIPNLLVQGMAEALVAAKAPLVYIANLMTEKGQTGSYSAQDFAKLIQKYIGTRSIDYVVYNTAIPDQPLLERYKKEMEREPVQLDWQKGSYRLVGANLVGRPTEKSGGSADALAASRTLIRHDSAVLGEVLQAILMHRHTQKYLS